MKAQELLDTLPQYAYLPSVVTSAAGFQSSLIQEYNPDWAMNNLPRFANSHTHISNAFITGDQQSAISAITACCCGHKQTTPAGVAMSSYPQQMWPPPNLPNSSVSAIPVDLMTTEQTAAWIRTISQFSGWEEAEEYASSFKENEIWGHLLPKLTVNSLKSELGIMKYGHRLEIILAIKGLYNGMAHGVEDNGQGSDGTKSPIPVDMSESEPSSLNVSPADSPKSFSCPKSYKFNQHDVESSSVGGPYLLWSTMVTPYCNGSLHPSEQAKEVLKWTGKPAKGENKIENPNGNDFFQADDQQIPSTEVLFFRVGKKKTSLES